MRMLGEQLTYGGSMEDPPKWVMRGQKRWATFVPKNIMTMDIISRKLIFGVLLLSACGTGTTAEEATGTQQDIPAVEAATACDPLVGEFRDLMADYEAGLKEMVADGKVDEERQKEWSAKAKDLGERINAKGERELGLKCYQEFNTIGQVYAPRIAELGMQLALLQMKDKGMDPAAMEQVKKAMGK